MGEPKKMSLRVEIGGSMYEYNPKPEITAHQAALLHKFIAICIASPTPPEMMRAYINDHSLWNHFDSLEKTK
jgi:hypothetical protein